MTVLPARIAKLCLEEFPLNDYDKELYAERDLIDLIVSNSSTLRDNLAIDLRVLEFAHPERLDSIHVAWLPTYLFMAAAFRSDDEDVIALSQGFLSLVEFVAEIMAFLPISTKIEELLPQGSPPPPFTASNFMNLFTDVFLTQVLDPRRAVPVPTVKSELPKELLEQTLLLDAFARGFIFFHELGHIELGNLTPSASPRIATHRDVLVVDEVINVKKDEEYEADEFAISQGSSLTSQLLLGGARMFFLIYLLAENAVERRADTHPHTSNRLANLVSKFAQGEDESELFGNMVASVRGRPEQAANRDRLGQVLGDWIENSGAPAEIAKIWLLTEIKKKMLEVYRARPKDFLGMFPYPGSR